MKASKKRLKGFTLAETMTSLFITVILISVASGVIITTFNIFGRNTVMRMAQTHGNNVYNYLYDHISYATALKIDRTVDINYIGEERPDLSFLTLNEQYMDETTPSGEKTINITDYYEMLVVSKEWMIIQRKDVPADPPVYIFGRIEEDEAELKNTMNGFQCRIKFEGYTAGSGNVDLTVQILRDNGNDDDNDDVLYSRSGSIPLLNDVKDEHIAIPDGGIDNNTEDFKIFYTYIQ